MTIASLAGAISGLAMVLSMYRAGMLAERSSVAVLISAIAAFWPVFAVQAGAGGWVIALHVAGFLAFSAFALIGFRKGMGVLAAALAAHGVLDLTAHITSHPGPQWWPVFCGSLDLAAAVAIVMLLKQGKISR